MRTKEKLATDLRNANAPAELIARAERGEFDDFESESATPITDLITAATENNLFQICENARNGMYDASKEEAQTWAKENATLIQDLWKAGQKRIDTAAILREIQEHIKTTYGEKLVEGQVHVLVLLASLHGPEDQQSVDFDAFCTTKHTAKLVEDFLDAIKQNEN